MIVVLGSKFSTEKVLGVDQCQTYRNVVNSNNGNVGLGNIEVTRRLGESFCDIKNIKLGANNDKTYAVKQCQKNSNGVMEFVEITQCSKGGVNGKCEEVGTKAECRYSNYSTCTSYDGTIRKDGERGCINQTTVGVCDGYHGVFASVITCQSGEMCMNSSYILLSDAAVCKPASCTDGDVTADNRDKACVGGNIKWCSFGKFVDDKNCNNQGCIQGKNGPECRPKGVIQCGTINNVATDRQINPGQDICSPDQKSIYKCTTESKYTAISCGSDEKCIEYSDKPSVCIKNSTALPPGAKDQTTIDKQNQKGSSTLTMQLSENKGTVFCDGKGNNALKEPASSDNVRVYTAFGCVPATVETFIKWLLPYLFGIAGGISFLLMVFGFIKVATSAGDPKEIEGAKETITSALIGLIVSIFALFILKLILVGILKIPGIS
jgi:hypothetical protein